MLKLVVLTLLVAAAAAKPGLLSVGPYSYAPYLSAGYVAPYVGPAVAATYTAALAPAPLAYNAGYAHLIKKRSAPLFASSYLAPSVYYARPGYVAPLAAAYSAPLVHSAYAYTAPLTHLIKKRSAAHAHAPVATSYSSSYFAPATYAAAAPFYASAYSTPYYTAPLAYSSPFFIKK